MKVLSKILLLVLAATPCMAQVATNDLFNRATSTNVGIDWFEVSGDVQIAGNQLRATNAGSNSWCSHTAFAANYANTVVQALWAMNGVGGGQITLIAGANPVTWSAVEVKISDQNGDGMADRIIFNASVNAGQWYTSPSFQNMTTPMASGEATMWFSNAGDTVNISLRDLVTSAVQTYSASGITTHPTFGPPTGTRVGVGFLGNGSVDDFRAWTGSPTTPSFTTSTPRVGGSTTMLVTGTVPMGFAAIGYSVAGAGPVATPLGILGLTDPIEVLWQGPTDAAGRAELPPLGPIGPVAGLTVYVQAVDLVALALTNYFTIVVQ